MQVKNPMILVSEVVSAQEYLEGGDSHHLRPRLDYIEIAKRINGSIYGRGFSDSLLYRLTLRLEKRIKLDLVESLFASFHLGSHNFVLSTSEKCGLPMASLLALARQDLPHILISHNISSRNKRRLFRLWPLYKSFSKFIFVSKPQERYAIDVLGIHPSKVTFTYDNIDHEFFAPRETECEDYILAIGNEQRDYQTLFSALRGTNLKVVIGASSPWSSATHKIRSDPNITQLSRVSFTELRDIYARARLIVLPLRDVDYAAGANATLEAMAMAKPLILSETRGLEGYVSHDETGWLVPSGDEARLRESILDLWDNPVAQKRLGANARQAVESRMNMQSYVDTISEAVGRSVVDSVQQIPRPVDLLEIR